MAVEICSTAEDFDASDIRCFVMTLSLVLRIIYFHWITLSLLALIILISIFGKIKANYRWFILNQAIWDVCVTYDYYCNNNFVIIRCFYRVFLTLPMWMTILYSALNIIFRMNSYSAFFLLTISRFLCLYFNNFYEKITKKFRIFFFILFITMAFLSTTIILSTCQAISNTRYLDIQSDCKKMNISQSKCYTSMIKPDSVYSFFIDAGLVFDRIDKAKGPACIIGALIPSFLIVRKVSSQFKFQYNNNRKDFYGSLRIAIVLMLQLLFNAIILIFESLQSIYSGKDSDDPNDRSFFSLFKGPFSFTNIQTFRQIRVFLECIIILTIMTGYREAIFKLSKWIFHGFKKNQITPAVSSAVRSSSGIVFINQR